MDIAILRQQSLESYDIRTLPSQSERRKTSGIYAIINRFSGSFYIGSSDHVVRRWRAHISRLRRGVHHSPRLQAAWLRDGDGAFDFVLIQSAERDALIAVESHFIETCRPSYNIAASAPNPMTGRRHSPEAILKMKLNRVGKG